ncbi:MAG: hypothetical protein AAB607_00910, partial [Patescibacteria group bacterium]
MEHRKQYDTKIILRRREEREIPKGKAGVVFCKDCGAVYYKKSWHHNLRDYKNFSKDLPVSFVLCPACEMIKNNQFEGRIIIENIPAKNSEDLRHLIEGFCHRAYLRDPLDRLIKIKKPKVGVLEIITTENQLAAKLAKKIKEVFKKITEKISYSASPSDVVYIQMKFK